MLGALRPVHWIKNLLVFAAPAAAGSLTERGVWIDACIVFVAFSAIASSVYLINDILDAESDRRHPSKQNRPIASGVVSMPLAGSVAGVLAAGGLALGWIVGVVTAGVLLTYLGISIAYSVSLKQIAVVELVVVALGFVLRAAAGAAAADVVISTYFLTVVAFAALAVAAGKRGSELRRVGEGSTLTRPVLQHYSDLFLGQVQTMATGGALIVYALWAFESANLRPGGAVWISLSVVPLTLIMLRYLLAADHGRGESPERLLFTDRVIAVAAVSWAVLFVLGVRP